MCQIYLKGMQCVYTWHFLERVSGTKVDSISTPRHNTKPPFLKGLKCLCHVKICCSILFLYILRVIIIPSRYPHYFPLALFSAWRSILHYFVIMLSLWSSSLFPPSFIRVIFQYSKPTFPKQGHIHKYPSAVIVHGLNAALPARSIVTIWTHTHPPKSATPSQIPTASSLHSKAYYFLHMIIIHYDARMRLNIFDIS